jgi:hypothetical protein
VCDDADRDTDEQAGTDAERPEGGEAGTHGGRRHGSDKNGGGEPRVAVRPVPRLGRRPWTFLLGS